MYRRRFNILTGFVSLLRPKCIALLLLFRWSDGVKCCIVLHCTAFHCIASHRGALHSIALYRSCVGLDWIALCRIASHRISSYYITLSYYVIWDWGRCAKSVKIKIFRDQFLTKIMCIFPKWAYMLPLFLVWTWKVPSWFYMVLYPVYLARAPETSPSNKLLRFPQSTKNKLFAVDERYSSLGCRRLIGNITHHLILQLKVFTEQTCQCVKGKYFSDYSWKVFLFWKFKLLWYCTLIISALYMERNLAIFKYLQQLNGQL